MEDRTKDTRGTTEEKRRATTNGMRMARYVIAKLSHGKTDMPARAGRFDTKNLGPVHVRRDDSAFEIAKNILAEGGVVVDTYSRYEGSGETSDRIVVTEVDGTTITPSYHYQHELNLRETTNQQTLG